MEWLICSIFSSSIAAAARAHQLASLTRAIIPSYESCFAAANSIWGSAQGMSASNCLHSPSGCADGHLSQRHSLMETRISLQRHSSVASLHRPLLGSIWSWYTLWFQVFDTHLSTGLLCLLRWSWGK